MQPLERLPRVQVVHARRHVERCQQHLRRVDVPRREPLLVGAEERALADGRRGLELVDLGGAPVEPHDAACPQAIAPEVTSATFSPSAWSSPTCSQTPSSTSARSSPSSPATIDEPSFATTVMGAQV